MKLHSYLMPVHGLTIAQEIQWLYDRFCHEMEVLEHKEDVQNMLLLLFWQIIAKTSLVPEATKIKIT